MWEGIVREVRGRQVEERFENCNSTVKWRKNCQGYSFLRKDWQDGFEWKHWEKRDKDVEEE
jgi:hypothetical protein